MVELVLVNLRKRVWHKILDIFAAVIGHSHLSNQLLLYLSKIIKIML
jgi:hypothetical protein